MSILPINRCGDALKFTYTWLDILVEKYVLSSSTGWATQILMYKSLFKNKNKIFS